MRMRTDVSLVVVLCALAAGCSYYTPPGRGADMQRLGLKEQPATSLDGTIGSDLARRPMARFPTAIAVARIQAPNYRSDTATSWGTGAYSIVTTRDVEEPREVERLAQMPGVLAIAPINRLLMNTSELHSDIELRQAAAKLHADLLLIYTLDTTFKVDDKAAPLSVVTLGLSPNQWANVVCTASAVLMDTRNGYVYGVSEQTVRQGQLASAWTSSAAVDDARKRAETIAFKQLVGDLERTWAGVYRTYGGNAAPAAATPTPAAIAPKGRAISNEWHE
jgi:hypothetical protein